MIATISKPIRKRRQTPTRRCTFKNAYTRFFARVQYGPNLYPGYFGIQLQADPKGKSVVVIAVVGGAVVAIGGVVYYYTALPCCAKYVADQAYASLNEANQIVGEGADATLEGTPADALKHCMLACRAMKAPWYCPPNFLIRKEIQSREQDGTYASAQDYHNNRIGFGITGDCKIGCLNQLQWGSLKCFRDHADATKPYKQGGLIRCTAMLSASWWKKYIQTLE